MYMHMEIVNNSRMCGTSLFSNLGDVRKSKSEIMVVLSIKLAFILVFKLMFLLMHIYQCLIIKR